VVIGRKGTSSRQMAGASVVRESLGGGTRDRRSLGLEKKKEKHRGIRDHDHSNRNQTKLGIALREEE